MTINFSDNNPYNYFFKQIGTVPPKTADSSATTVPAVNIGEVQKTQEKSRKKLFGIIGISAGSALLLTIIALFTLSKGFSGSFAKSVKNLAESSREKIKELTQGTKNLTNKQKLQLQWNQFVEKSAQTLQAGSNVTAIKDSFFLHWLKKFKMNKFVNKVNNVFKKIILKTKNNSYSKAEYSVVDLYNYLNKIAKESPEPAVTQELLKKSQNVLKQYMSEFSTVKHTARSQEAWESMNTLHTRVYNSIFKPEEGLLKSVKKLRTYITTTLITPEKEAMFAKLIKKQSLIEQELNKTLELAASSLKKESPEYTTLIKKVQKLNKHIKSAISHESAAYDKLAELQVGSAHTDIIGILAPTALATFFVVKSKDKDELIHNTLTRGIPIIGGVATGYYGNTRGFTGVKNLALGLTTGYLLNIIGTETNKLVKKYRAEQAKLKKAFEDFKKLQLKMHKEEAVK